MFTKQESGRTRLQNRSLLFRLIGSLLAIVLLVFLVREENWSDIWGAVKRVSPQNFILALALLYVSRLSVVGRWHVLLRSAGTQATVKDSTWLTFTGLFASNFLPTTVGGDLVRLAGAIQLGWDQPSCIASLIVDRLVGMFSSILALPFGLIPLFNTPILSTTINAMSFMAFMRPVVDFSKRTFSAFSIWIKKPVALLISLCFACGNMLLIFAAVFVLANGLGPHISYWLVAGLWSLTYFVTLIPISINGYGVQEISLTFLLTSLGGLSNAESLTVAVLVRIIFVLASLPGAIFLPSMASAMGKIKTKLT